MQCHTPGSSGLKCVRIIDKLQYCLHGSHGCISVTCTECIKKSEELSHLSSPLKQQHLSWEKLGLYKNDKKLYKNYQKPFNPNSFFIPLLFRVLYYPKFNLYSLYTEKVIGMMSISSSQWVKNLPSLMDYHIFQYFLDWNLTEELQSQEMRIKIERKMGLNTHLQFKTATHFIWKNRDLSNNNEEGLRNLIP